MDVSMNTILNELKNIKTELDYIKQHMPDKDSFMSAEETKLLNESYENEANNELTSSDDLRKELGL